MNRTLSRWRVHMWKEFRETRAPFLILLGTVALAAPLAVELVLRCRLPWIGLPAGMTLFGAALAILVLGAEALSRDLNGDRPVALSRLPGGLAAPFTVRVVLFAMQVFGVCAVAYGASHAALAPRVDASLGLHVPITWPLLATGTILACWTLATSCWLRQGLLAAPTAALLVGLLLALPLTRPIHGMRGLDFLTEDVGLAVALLCLAGLAAAAVSFRSRLRSGRGRGRALATGVAALLLGCAPLYGLGVHRYHQWTTLDPSASDFTIRGGMVSTSGRYAYLEVVRRRSAGHVLRVDLTTGAWTRVARFARVGSIGLADGGAARGQFQSPVGLVRITRYGLDDANEVVLDANSGERLWVEHATMEPFSSRPARHDARVRAERRRLTPLRLNGQPAWFLRDRLEFAVGVDSDAYRERVIESELRLAWISGNGYTFFGPRQDGGERTRHFHDLFSDARHTLHPAVHWTLPSSVGLLVNLGKNGPRLVGDDGLPRDVPYLQDDDKVFEALDDGALLIGERRGGSLGDRSELALARLDPATGQRSLILRDGGAEVRIRHLDGGSLARTPEGRRVMRLTSTWESGMRLARLDEQDLRVAVADTPVYRVVGSTDEASAIAIGPSCRRLIRVYFGSDRVDVLFPSGAGEVP